MKFLGFLLLLFSLSTSALADATLDRELIYRVNFGRADDIKLLIQQGADPNTRNDLGMTAVSVATDRNDAASFDIVKALVDGGANVNVADENRNFPIILATRNGRADIVAYLIEKGADFYIKDSAGNAVIDVAKNLKQAEVEKIIQASIDKDLERLARLKSPENLQRFVTEYAFEHCSHQYWSYYLASKQDKNINDADIKSRIAANTDKANSIAIEVQSLFGLQQEKLQEVANGSRSKVFRELEEMLTNRNRKAKGVGTEADFNKRCQKIAGEWKIDMPPQTTTNPSSFPSPR